jgi:Ca2+-binding RTX toxin-like protein
VLAGGTGNDTYITDGGDTITEMGVGTDTVQSSATFTLGANLENLALTGSGAIHGTGNSQANNLVGNGGANSLNGGLGNDNLTGGVGIDTFVFNTTLGAGNIDRITDFNVTGETIRLEGSIFIGIGNGKLSRAEFHASNAGTARDKSDRIIYDKDTGRLFWDEDGKGGDTQVHFATINANLAINNADFFVF